MTIARSIITDDTFAEWRQATEPVTVINLYEANPEHPNLAPDACVSVYQGSPAGEGGATIYWSDGVTGEWAELYNDLPTCLARTAALAKCLIDGDGFFRDGPEGFVRWADNLFTQTVTGLPTPSINMPRGS